MSVQATSGGTTDKDRVIYNCAVEHLERASILCPSWRGYDPTHYSDVFTDISDLFLLSLTTNRKNIVDKDSRAVGIKDIDTPFEHEVAKAIVSDTTFVSKYGRWEIEIKHPAGSGTLVKAVLPMFDSEDSAALARCLELEKSVDEPEKEELVGQRKFSLRYKTKIEELEIVQKYKLAKTEYLKRQIALQPASPGTEELKQRLAEAEEDWRIGNQTLAEKRETVKAEDREYFGKLKAVDDANAAARRPAGTNVSDDS